MESILFKSFTIIGDQQEPANTRRAVARIGWRPCRSAARPVDGAPDSLQAAQFGRLGGIFDILDDAAKLRDLGLEALGFPVR